MNMRLAISGPNSAAERGGEDDPPEHKCQRQKREKDTEGDKTLNMEGNGDVKGIDAKIP
jgi:hypothetical protein